LAFELLEFVGELAVGAEAGRHYSTHQVFRSGLRRAEAASSAQAGERTLHQN
jgi:hypothetical protein